MDIPQGASSSMVNVNQTLQPQDVSPISQRPSKRAPRKGKVRRKSRNDKSDPKRERPTAEKSSKRPSTLTPALSPQDGGDLIPLYEREELNVTLVTLFSALINNGMTLLPSLTTSCVHRH
jgi:hypothetical protein